MSGLPGTSGFVGEFLTMLGTFRDNIPIAIFATLGVILSAAYALWLYRSIIFGALVKPSLHGIQDLGARNRDPGAARGDHHPVRLLSETGVRHVHGLGHALVQTKAAGAWSAINRRVLPQSGSAVMIAVQIPALFPSLPELSCADRRHGCCLMYGAYRGEKAGASRERSRAIVLLLAARC